MKKMLLAGLMIFGMLATVRAYEIQDNPDKYISFGLNYDRTGQNSDYTFRNLSQTNFTKVNSNAFIADMRIPLNPFLTFQLRGGYLTQNNDIFTGENVSYTGYDVGAGIRIYIH